MKKSYMKKKYTTIALNPEMTRRIEKVLKNKGMKLSKYAQAVLKSALDADEREQTLEFYKKLMSSDQYQKIKQLEDEVKELKEYHITEKKLDKKLEKLKSQRIDDLEKKLATYGSVNQYIIHHYLPAIKKNVKEYNKWLREDYTEEERKEIEEEKQRILKKHKKRKKL